MPPDLSSLTLIKFLLDLYHYQCYLPVWCNKCTTDGYCLRPTSDKLDIMGGSPNMNSFYIMIDNLPVQSPDAIDPAINERKYIPLYLSPY
ncbi:hypothetical protein BY458DRAFT_359205 [Sporodiniella umbellata]|nr:hypothetical protein BY458DRAFT_359205 [Sporodiniella umbellata]